MAKLSREALLNPGPQTLDVDIPELGGSVTIKRLTIGERDQAATDAGEERTMYGFIAACLVDPVMSLEDVSELLLPVYDRIRDAALEHNTIIVVDEETEEVTAGAEAATATFPAGEPEGDAS